MEKLCRVINYVWSSAVLLGGLLVTAVGISKGAYVLPVSVPVAYVLFVTILILIFYLEGLMICVTRTKDMLPSDIDSMKYHRAHMIHRLINASPNNMKRFIVGRQFLTVLSTFIIAQLTTYPEYTLPSSHPVLFWLLFRSGLCGVFIVLGLGQLLPELMAEEVPLDFMNLYGSYTVVQLSLFFDSLGVGSAGWLLYFAGQRCIKWRRRGRDGDGDGKNGDRDMLVQLDEEDGANTQKNERLSKMAAFATDEGPEEKGGSTLSPVYSAAS